MATNFTAELQVATSKGPAARKEVIEAASAVYLRAKCNLANAAPMLGVSVATLKRAVAPARNPDLAAAFAEARERFRRPAPPLHPKLDPGAFLAFLEWLDQDKLAGFVQLDDPAHRQLRRHEVMELLAGYNDESESE